MIKRLKVKFVALAMSALFILLSVIVAGMNLITFNAIISEADSTLAILSQNRGSFPDWGDLIGPRPPEGFSPELPHESRYFSILLDKTFRVMYTDTTKISSVDSMQAVRYAKTVLKQSDSRGFIDHFRFLCYVENNDIRIIFLDCSRMLDSFRTFLYASSGMALSGLIIALFVFMFFSGRILRPIAESYEKQKRFITDAGHEIKTPLTIINANVDVLEMELGPGNECLEDIQLQTKRLTSLTNDLVLLSRMEESEGSMQMIEFPLSEVVSDAALSFRTPAQAQRKVFSCDIQPTLSINGNSKAIEKLVCILMDNALKYSPASGTIRLTLEQHMKQITLSVFNTTVMEISQEQLNHVFDRFYRTDASRNSETGGHGIGLSVAKAIVSAHGGRIQVNSADPYEFQVTVSLPVQ